jgi:hypothetical protein
MSTICSSTQSCEPQIVCKQPDPEPAAAKPVPESARMRPVATDQVVSVPKTTLADFGSITAESARVFFMEGAAISARPPTKANWAPAPSLSTVAAGRKLGSGHSGSSVRQAQRMLRNGGSSINEDGYFGPKTQAAVVRFQKTHGIEGEGGRIGNKTLSALREDYQTRDGDFLDVHRSIRPQAQRLSQDTNSELFTAKLEDLTRSTQFQGLVGYVQSDLLSAVAEHTQPQDRLAALQRQLSLADHGNLKELAEFRSIAKG